MAKPSAELRERLMAELGERPAPVRRTVRRRRAALVVLGLAPVAAGAAMHGVHWGGRPGAMLLMSLAATALVAAVVTWWTVAPARSTLGRARPLLLGAALAVPATAAAVAILAALLWPETQQGGALELGAHLPCFLMMFVLAAAPFGAWMWERRGSDPVRPAATGAALGASAGAWATLAMTLGCGQSGLVHVGLGHLLPLVVLTGLGALLGSSLLRLPRASTQVRDGARTS